jgi:hypothetical protein
MAGHRRSRAAANPDGQSRPTSAASRVANREAAVRGNYAGAQDEPSRFKAAVRALLSADAALRPRDARVGDAALADELLRGLTNDVLRAATAMTARRAELSRPRRPRGRPDGGQWTA